MRMIEEWAGRLGRVVPQGQDLELGERCSGWNGLFGRVKVGVPGTAGAICHVNAFCLACRHVARMMRVS